MLMYGKVKMFSCSRYQKHWRVLVGGEEQEILRNMGGLIRPSLDLCESKCLKNLPEHSRWFVVVCFPLIVSKYLVIFFFFY